VSRRVFILGSTGSIGCNAVKTILHLRKLDGDGSWPVAGLAAGNNIALLHEQAVLLGVDTVSHCSGTSLGIANEYTSAVQLIQEHAQRGDVVVAAIVGFAGISPVLAAIECGCDIALANKESLVSGGQVVLDAVAKANVQLLPVDSEHSAIFQALASNDRKSVKKIILTASGGALLGFSKDEVASATVSQVLNHPTWKMGAKVTVDSASLMNKALELIEAHWLFGIGPDKLEAIIHPQSIVHGMVEYTDGSVLAQLSPPDMRLPIQYALTWPHRVEGFSASIDWQTFSTLEFQQIDYSTFPAISLAYDIMKQGGTSGAILNAANEIVVTAFLEQGLPFGSMITIVSETLDKIEIVQDAVIGAVIEADEEARSLATQLVANVTVHT
jgi:1-deoxy-D-xylulose-5-phosphate reductoisomerase